MAKKTFTLDSIQDLRKAGIYLLYKNNALVYIGISKNVYVRILEHSFEDKKDFDSIEVINTKEDANYTITEIMEIFLINHYRPQYNKLVVDDMFTFFNSLPSIVKDIVGKDGFEKATELSKSIINQIETKRAKA